MSKKSSNPEEELKFNADEAKASSEDNNEIATEENELNEEVDNVEELKASEDLDAGEDSSEETPIEKEEVDYKSKYFYLAAEMDNLHRRNNNEREKLLKYGNEKVLSSLVEVVDNLDRTISALEKDDDDKVKNIVTGVNMVRKQFLDVLSQNGLSEVESLGKIFDPNFHEAMAQQPAEDKEDQEIITEFQKGYVLNGRLLRAAKVIIAKNS